MMCRTSHTAVPVPEVGRDVHVSSANTDKAGSSALPNDAGELDNVNGAMRYVPPGRRSGRGGTDVRGVIKYLPQRDSISPEYQRFDIPNIPADRFCHPVVILSKGREGDTDIVRICLVRRVGFSSA